MRGLNRVAAFFGIIAAIAWIMVALSVAQTATLPPETPTHQTVPEAAQPGSGGSGEPLSDKLDRSGGTIRPPTGIDPGIAQPPPAAGPGSTPVIPPPGTPANRPDVTPK